MEGHPARTVVCGLSRSEQASLATAPPTSTRTWDVVLWHEQSIADLALELLEGPAPARAIVVTEVAHGLSPEVRRDTRMLAALGITDLTLVVIGADEAVADARYQEITDEWEAIARSAGVEMPASVGLGDRGQLAAYLSENASAHVEHRTPSPAGQPADSYRVNLVWTSAEPLLPGRAYTLVANGKQISATVAPLRYRLDLETGEHLAATMLQADEIGVCDIELTDPIVLGASGAHRSRAFALLDRLDGERTGIGFVRYALRRSTNVRRQRLSIGKLDRAESLRQRPSVLWLTGLSGAGKSTIANRVEAELHSRGYHTYLLDGDNVRRGLNSDLGFTATDRVENIRRVAEVARLMAEAGLIVIVSFISPFRAERLMARGLLEPDEFFEVWVDTPLAVAEQRDPKGLYAKARRGDLANFTGIDSPYEPPEHPEIRIDTTCTPPEEAAAQIVETLEREGRLG